MKEEILKILNNQHEINMDIYAETVKQFPFMEIEGKLVQLTNVHLTEENGNEIYVVIDKKNKPHLLSVNYIPDCDGSYYNVYYNEKDYKINLNTKVNYDFYWSGEKLFEFLNKIYLSR